MNLIRRILDWLGQPVDGFHPDGYEPEVVRSQDMEMACADRIYGYAWFGGVEYYSDVVPDDDEDE